MTVIEKSPVYSIEVMFAAACAAYRANGNKVIKVPISPNGLSPNKILMLKFLEEQENLTEEDFINANGAIRYCKGLTFKLLKKGSLGDFENKLLLLSDQDTINESYVGIIAYVPEMYTRDMTIGKVIDEHLSVPGDKITSTVEVVRSNYSQQYGCYFITVVTDCNHNVFFSYKEALEVQQKYSIKGTVKAHRPEWVTQLTRTKVTKI